MTAEHNTAYNLQFYFGKEEQKQTGVPLAQNVVMFLARPLYNTGRSTTCDNFFVVGPSSKTLR